MSRRSEMSAVDARIRAVRSGMLRRWSTTVRLAIKMMLYDKAKLVGTTLGVVFAVVLSTQQLGVLFGLLQKNTMFVDNAKADVWVCPPGTIQLQGGQRLSESILVQVRNTPGVALAAPLVFGTSGVQRPTGGTEAITMVGTEVPDLLGGPWNVVEGDPMSLTTPNAVFFEDARREKMGDINLGSVREIAGHEVVAVGFTWGLMPFGPPYAFSEVGLARTLLGFGEEEQSFVLVKVADGETADGVAARLQERLPETKVWTQKGFHDSIVKTLLGEQLGITFGTSTAFGLLIGFIIVALSMFSAVLDNIKEFGTLKAIGVTNGDLSRLLFTQSVLYALLGSFVGLGVVGFASEGIRSANLSLVLPWQLLALAPAVMTLLCLVASVLALQRVRRLEPGMVFR